ncbi:hypothetical protein EVC29_124 [Rhizobium phage RHph_Y52]|nr:hypothetical protein EVC16_124 [Rhizobium phage RHph_Y21]QIG76825.1 hypothetical protein EVC29_124 [Rhizobium phage RHph_Y52]
MTIEVTSEASNYRPESVLKRYVRANGNRFAWCEVGADRRFDLRQGRCDAEDLPPDVIMAAREREGYFPSYVDWP